jgi:hypothetical protein
MNSLKKYLGIIWLLLGPAFIFFLVRGAILNIDPHQTKEIHNPVVWIIIITIFTPIGIGLMIFGWYALKGQYTQLPEKSSELKD